MSFRSPSRRYAFVVLVLPLLLAACDDQDSVMPIAAGGNLSSPSHSVNAMVIPSTTLPFQIMPIRGCPFGSTFRSHFSIVVDSIGADLTLKEVGLQFVDTTGFVSPVALSQHDLTVLFGSPIIASGKRRSFAFQPQFGCGFTGTPHLMSGRLNFVDRSGVHFERTVSARLGR